MSEDEQAVPMDLAEVNTFWDSVRVFSADSNIPPKVQIVLTMRSFGMPAKEIAEQLGYADKSAIYQILRRWPQGRDVTRADAMRRLALVSMTEHLMVSLFGELAKDYQEGRFRKIPSEKKMQMLGECARMVSKLGGQNRLPLNKDEQSVLSKLGVTELIGEVVETK